MRVLIATVTAGAGHLQAAAALEEAWRSARPRDAVQRLDVLEFTPKLYRKMYTEGYVKFVERAPELWGMFFKKTDSPALMRKLTRWRRRTEPVPSERQASASRVSPFDLFRHFGQCLSRLSQRRS